MWEHIDSLKKAQKNETYNCQNLKENLFFYLANICINSIVKTKCYTEVNIVSTSLINFAITASNICVLFGTSNVFEVAVENKSTHMDSTGNKFRRMSLVDNLSISQMHQSEGHLLLLIWITKMRWRTIQMKLEII